MSLPQLLPLPEAAEKLGLSVRELRTRVEAGTIAAGRLPDGEIVVSDARIETNGAVDINARLRAIQREDFEHLRGQAITVTEAAEKYGIHRDTISDWAKRYAKHIQILKPGYRMELDEADIAYLTTVHRTRKEIGILSGAPLLEENGRPYLLRHPNLSRYRREQRQSG